MDQTKRPANSSKIQGLLIGGSGLIGGYITHYFKTKLPNEVEIRAPNSKKLSLRSQEDIRNYCRKVRPDFIINSAIATINSDEELCLEVNYLGSLYLARAALALNIPYIHISSAATLPMGENLKEEDFLPLTSRLSNYAKSKLMSEQTLEHMHQTEGLDYTIIRMAVVYGQHDHKIQGIQRMLFSIVEDSMLFLLTKKGVMHSYSNANKLPYFVHHILQHREEFSGQTYNFVDPEPVRLDELILTIKSLLNSSTPKKIYIPYPLAKMAKGFMGSLFQVLGKIGVRARLPAELMFLENFYRTQTLSAAKLLNSSFSDPNPEATIYTELPQIINYYLNRWTHLNLINFDDQFIEPEKKMVTSFRTEPQKLMGEIKKKGLGPLSGIQ
ncbi:MAG: NAD-dependent epimerase/dehydratase family protein [Desulfobacterales bacterium]|nr:NAD-dependent epimerase/dehydratase family protein [Desulfobacterales bacterium]